MGLRFRKSISLGGGFRLNFSKSGIGVSGGIPGFRVSAGPSGKRTSVGIPGTGIFYEKRESWKKKEAISKPEVSARGPKKIRLGLLRYLILSKKEKLFVKAVNNIIIDNKTEALHKLRQVLQEDSLLTDANFTVALLTEDEEERLTAVKRAIENKARFGELFEKYGVWMGVEISVTPDICLRITNDILGFYLFAAEVLQDAGQLEAAIELLEKSGMDERPEVKLSLGELYYINGCYDEAIRLLQGMENEDAVGTNALLLLGMSFREKGMNKAAIDTLRKARRRTKERSPSLILEGRYQLALTLEEDGKKHLARKEYEKVLAVDYDYRDVRERLAELEND
ncbi:MAG: hypothetical protein PWR10_1233 [Halanaerobiales bacterium]|nr:hypothetical protein [Halanaerobiales bacterium]